MTQREKLIEELKGRAVKLRLSFVHTRPSFYSGERFAIMHSDGRMVLAASDDPALIEHYLFGYRDGRKDHD